MTPDEVKQARKMIGVTQSTLAKLLGVSTVAVGNWEQGRHAIRGEHETRLKRMAIDRALSKIKKDRPEAVVGGYTAKPESRPVAASKRVEQAPGSVERWPGFHSERGGAFDEYLWGMFP